MTEKSTRHRAISRETRTVQSVNGSPGEDHLPIGPRGARYSAKECIADAE